MTSFENMILPPNNYDVEKNIITCALLDEDVLFDCPIKATDFYARETGMIFDAIMEVRKSHKVIDVITVANQLESKWLLDVVGWMDYLYDLATWLLTTSWYESYKDILLELSYLRRTHTRAKRLSTMALDREDRDSIMKIVKEIVDDGSIGKSRGLLMEEVIWDKLENLWSKVDIICRYGYPNLDKILGWYSAGQLIVIGARPWIGKSMLSVNFCDNISAQRVKVSLFSLEMTASEISDRVLSLRSGISTRHLHMKEHEENIIVSAGERVQPDMFKIYDNMTRFNDIANEIRLAAIRDGVRIFFIDYLQLMVPPSKAYSRNDSIGEMTSELKRIAMEQWVCIVLLSQLSRASAKEYKQPTLTDLRDSGNIEQDANNVYLLYKDNDNDAWNGVMKIIIAKQRAGETWNVYMLSDASKMLLSDIDQQDKRVAYLE